MEEILFQIRKQSNGSVNISKARLLHYSVERGLKKLTQYLLDNDYDANVQNSSGTTPLMLAVRNKRNSIIKMLLAAGADLMMLNNKNMSALHMACTEHLLKPDIRKLILLTLRDRCSNSEEIAQILIKAGCHLYQAAYLRDSKVIKYMLEQGFSVESVHPFVKQSALHVAVSVEDVDSVKVLLKYGANVKAKDQLGFSPLSYVYKYNAEHTSEKIELLRILLNRKEVSPLSCNNVGVFQIIHTLVNGNQQAIRVVLKSNIDFTAKDQNNEQTMLHYLALNTNPGVIEEWKAHAQYSVNLVDKSGMSPLHMAVIQKNINMVQFLLSQGFAPNCAHKQYGFTPLYFAFANFEAKYGDQWDTCIDLLLQYNADPQFIVTSQIKNERMTVFDITAKTNSLNKMKSVIAHLAVLKELAYQLLKLLPLR